MCKKRNSFISKQLCISVLFVLLIFGCTFSNAILRHLSHREGRKLMKLALAASLFTPPGFGILPIPLPVPLPFSVESVKPPVILTSPFVPFLHGGHGIGFGGGIGGGGFGGGGFGGGGAFYGRR